MAVKPIPEGYHTVSPYLAVDDAEKAIEYYKKAFGAEETVRMNAPDGKIGHAELKIGDSHVMLSRSVPAVEHEAAEGARRHERERLHVRRGRRRGRARRRSTRARR